MGVSIRALTAAIALAILCVLPGPLSAQLEPQGVEFQINQYTTDFQANPGIAADAAGNFVVVWSSYGQDGSSGAIVGRRYDSASAPVGDEFQVNTYTTGFQQQPTVAVSPVGDFIVVWNGFFGQDGDRWGLYAQRFDSTGARVGSEFQVNSYTTGTQSGGRAAFGTAGDFVVVWYNNLYSGSAGDVMARRYDSNGVALGTEFLVNSYTTGEQQFGATIAATGSGFVVVWSGPYLDGDSVGIVARRFDGSFAPLGTEFVVNTYTTSVQQFGHLAAGPAGDFVVAWTGALHQDGSGIGLFAQRFDSAGTFWGSEFQVNTYTTGEQSQPSIAVSPAGDFAIAWYSHPFGGGEPNVFARAFDGSGVADGDELQVNAFTTGVQDTPHIAAVGPARFVITWTSAAQDGSDLGVYGRRFAADGTPISGHKLLLRTPPSDPSKNRLVFKSSDPGLDAPAATEQDPRCPPLGSGSLAAGASVRVIGDGGDFTINLPCMHWSADVTRSTFRYRDATGGTCSVVLIKSGNLLKLVCKGPQIAYTLGAAQGDVHVILATGDPATSQAYCATFGPQTSATVIRDGSDGTGFKALNAGPGVCQ